MFVFDFLNIQQNYCILICCMEKVLRQMLPKVAIQRIFIETLYLFLFLLPVEGIPAQKMIKTCKRSLKMLSGVF